MHLTTATDRHRWLAWIVLVLCAGCSPGGPSPNGLVRFDDGEPVRSGSVEFRSVDSGARFAGRIGDDGRFRLQDQQGKPIFPPGEYEVVVVQIVVTEHLAAEMHQHGRTVPRHFADYYTSGLRVTNDAQRTEPIVVELKMPIP